MIILKNKNINNLGFVTIKGYDNCAINREGIIISLKYNKTSKYYYIITPVIDKTGYSKVKLYNNHGHRKSILLHRLVAITFISNPNNYSGVNHKDFNKQNNKVNNLEWCNRSYNVKYSVGHRIYDNPTKIRIKRINVITNEIKVFTSITNAVY